ncbi:hypothetical protein Btru_069929 [Bulinus truncatus]|nr:hypothetical protein Btru_069929 [Bulinus truncatus]
MKRLEKANNIKTIQVKYLSADHNMIRSLLGLLMCLSHFEINEARSHAYISPYKRLNNETTCPNGLVEGKDLIFLKGLVDTNARTDWFLRNFVGFCVESPKGCKEVCVMDLRKQPCSVSYPSQPGCFCYGNDTGILKLRYVLIASQGARRDTYHSFWGAPEAELSNGIQIPEKIFAENSPDYDNCMHPDILTKQALARGSVLTAGLVYWMTSLLASCGH